MFERLLKAPDLTTPDLELRAASASSAIDATLSTFEGIVFDLEEAEREHLSVADAARAEMDRLAELAELSEAKADHARSVSEKIRGLLS